MAMAKKIDLEEQVKALQKSMGGVVRIVKDLKSSVEVLEKKLKIKELNEIIEAQKVIDEVLLANSDAIKRIDQEIIQITNSKFSRNIKEDTLEDSQSGQKLTKKCRHFNRGYCKHKSKCRFTHPDNICNDYVTNGKCEATRCEDRHPKRCKWLTSKDGCTREGCLYLHNTDKQSNYVDQTYKCESCKDIWTNSNCVVEYVLHNQKVHFCLNCDDWVKYKQNVFNADWTLMDNNGYLRTGI